MSTIARLFDPLGILAPVIFFAKLLIREFWIRKLDWDADAPSDLKAIRLCFYDGLRELTNLQIPRHFYVFEESRVCL